MSNEQKKAIGFPKLTIPNPSHFRPGELLRPETVCDGIREVFHEVVPDPVDWIDWKGYPFHSAKLRNDITRIVERKRYDVNQKNQHGQTALHFMVAKGDKELVNSLLAVGADLELQDGEGNTPLHIAASKNSISVIQALLGFGAEENAENNKGDTPRHLAATSASHKQSALLYVLHAVGAKRCAPSKYGCNSGCATGGDHNGFPPPTPAEDSIRSIIDFYPLAELTKESNKGGRVLCLDGGGIKGVVLVAQLMALEKLTGKSPLESFDWITGTSTGGILASGLAAGYPLRDMMNCYFQLKDKVFGFTRPFNDKKLVQTLQDMLGERVMNDLQTCKLLITGTLSDKFPVKLHLFRNYAAPSVVVRPDVPLSDRNPPLATHKEQLVWQAARSSGAAPTYFEKFGRFIDGGLVANNPTLDTLTEIFERNLALKHDGKDDEVTDVSVVVSLGCGKQPVEEMDIDVVWPDDPVDIANNVIGVVKILEMLAVQTCSSDDAVVDRARAWCSMINVPYYRFSPTLHKNVDLAAKDDKVLSRVIWETRAYMYKHYQEVKACAAHLVK